MAKWSANLFLTTGFLLLHKIERNITIKQIKNTIITEYFQIALIINVVVFKLTSAILMAIFVNWMVIVGRTFIIPPNTVFCLLLGFLRQI